MAATGVGAPVGAGMATVGGAAATAGGRVVAGVGAGADSPPTVLNSAAEWAITGKTPDLTQQLINQGQRLITNMVLNKVPGLQAASQGKESQLKKQERQQRGSGDSGGYVLGLGGLLSSAVPMRRNPQEVRPRQPSPPYHSRHAGTDKQSSPRQQGNRASSRHGELWRRPIDLPARQPRSTQGSEHNTAHQCDSEICEALTPGQRPGRNHTGVKRADCDEGSHRCQTLTARRRSKPKCITYRVKKTTAQ